MSTTPRSPQSKGCSRFHQMDSESEDQILGAFDSSSQEDVPISTSAPARNFQQEVYQMLGENRILRSKLESIKAEHQKAMNDLISDQNRIRDEQKHELEEYKRRAHTEQLRHEFQLKELKARGMIPEVTNPTPPAPSQKQKSSTTTPKRRIDGPFSDGFVVKRPRSSGLSPRPLQEQLSYPQLAESEFNEQRVILAFLIAHKAPGFSGPSMQLLYEVPTHVEGVSLGQDFAISATRDELLLKILSHIGLRAGEFNSDVTALLLSLLYDLLFVPTSLQPKTMTDAPQMLMDILVSWLKELRPLPPLSEVELLGMMRLDAARKFIVSVYALDALLAMNWEFDLSAELVRLLFAVQDTPQLYIRGCDLISHHATSVVAAMLVREPPKVVVEGRESTLLRLLPDSVIPGFLIPSTEMLFRGLSDTKGYTVVQFVVNIPVNSAHFRIVQRVEDFRDFLTCAVERSHDFVKEAQCAWIRAAQAAIESNVADFSTEVGLDCGVLELLNYGLETVRFKDSLVVQLAVMYFWCRDVDALRKSMPLNNLTELCVCLTIIVNADVSEHNLVGKSQDILRDISSLEETEHFEDAFWPPDDEGNYTIETYSQT